jgi:hypothetical protein
MRSIHSEINRMTMGRVTFQSKDSEIDNALFSNLQQCFPRNIIITDETKINSGDSSVIGYHQGAAYLF